MSNFRFDHETMDVYRLAVDVARQMRRARWPHGFAWLKDQGLRSVGSTVLNIAEGRMGTPNSRANHYRIALCSAAEASAVLDLVDLEGGAELQEKLRRVGLMLTRLR